MRCFPAIFIFLAYNLGMRLLAHPALINLTDLAFYLADLLELS
jgi:hypothetical protein